ncbi:MAG TPA: DUF4405 domain-containing protein [Dehalococcoidales bacterium]|nr:DUF4405 domain-containing protein [Dehalococcoidales bacterium]
MRKATRNFILAITLILLSLVEVISGFVLWLAFPKCGAGAGRDWQGGDGGTLTFGTIPRDTWIDIHDWAAVALLVVVIIHVILHWQWIVHMSKSLVKRAP